MRLPENTIENQYLPQYADITVRPVSSPADLVGARGAAGAGWRVDVNSYTLAGDQHQNEFHAVLILGGAACRA
ncbi:hypothetical protein FHX82_006058 [Amycolatopsis bartoniae]|uniref:hypothetical protein n=1 Tax=Amycolatopsis bartoniae TaxID=941986 RepID=UPI00119346FB|nr:hypothetical protein [Amycolatopsis bartoniae]MBB2938972.1 hypothetical protein [Amycolatopsis bartoniae]TVT11227.1 hypothetical protein FNH07_02125 [Amycolatopsis bartoniae]